MKTFTDTCSMGLARDRASAIAIKEKQAAIEAGLEEMERGLERLGLRIGLCRDRMAKQSPVRPESLSLKDKFAAPSSARDLAERTRRIGFDTQAIERETRNNCRKLNQLAHQLKDEVAKRRAMEIRRSRPALKPVSQIKTVAQRPSAKILRFSPIKTDE